MSTRKRRRRRPTMTQTTTGLRTTGTARPTANSGPPTPTSIPSNSPPTPATATSGPAVGSSGTTRFEGASFTLVAPDGNTDLLELGYPEGATSEHVIIVMNGVWIGTLLHAQAADALANFISIMAATPAENFGYEPLEEVNRALTAHDAATRPWTEAP